MAAKQNKNEKRIIEQELYKFSNKIYEKMLINFNMRIVQEKKNKTEKRAEIISNGQLWAKREIRPNNGKKKLSTRNKRN